jgi:metal-dependent amidase/aminoacylase/carboxypeptidase family protein
MAMVLGAATVFNKIKNELKGNIKFLFQPAEEGPGGAKPMIEAGVMENPKVNYSIGCHVWPDIQEGTIGVRPGPFMAAMDRFDIKIKGKGGPRLKWAPRSSVPCNGSRVGKQTLYNRQSSPSELFTPEALLTLSPLKPN